MRRTIREFCQVVIRGYWKEGEPEVPVHSGKRTDAMAWGAVWEKEYLGCVKEGEGRCQAKPVPGTRGRVTILRRSGHKLGR